MSILGLFSFIFGVLVTLLIPALILVGIYSYSVYVRLVTLRNKVQEAKSGIDVQLTRRFDLIPNILTIAKKHMEHETNLFTNIAELRSQFKQKVESGQLLDLATREVEHNLENLMRSLFVSVESYPELKSDQSMLNAMNTYKDVENDIAATRVSYNSAASSLNTTIEIFPNNLIAPYAKATKEVLFQADEAKRQPVNAEDIL
jgi:LemA protein